MDDGGRGTLPFTVHGTGRMPGGSVTLDASSSSQFVSALLLAGARYEQGVTVQHEGPPVPSEPHIEMTIETLRDAGAIVDDSEPDVWRVEPSELVGLDVLVEPDLSNAAPFLAAALVTGGRVTVPGWPQHTTQAGDAIRDILDAMGADVSLARDGLTVSASGGVSGIDVDLHDASELTPVVAALAALADSPSVIRGVAHIRGHETDRLAALAREISALGGIVSETEDGLRIAPAAAVRGPVPHLRRPPHGHGGRRARPARPGRASSRTSAPWPRPCPTSSRSGNACSSPTETPPAHEPTRLGLRRERRPHPTGPPRVTAPVQGPSGARRRPARHGDGRGPRPVHRPRGRGGRRQATSRSGS